MAATMNIRKAKLSRSQNTQAVESDVLATAHEFATALHRVGAMGEPGKRDMDRLCLPPQTGESDSDMNR